MVISSPSGTKFLPVRQEPLNNLKGWGSFPAPPLVRIPPLQYHEPVSVYTPVRHHHTVRVWRSVQASCACTAVPGELHPHLRPAVAHRQAGVGPKLDTLAVNGVACRVHRVDYRPVRQSYQCWLLRADSDMEMLLKMNSIGTTGAYAFGANPVGIR